MKRANNQKRTHTLVYCDLVEAIEKFRSGNFLILVDDADRENEGDLIVAAEFVTAEKVT